MRRRPRDGRHERRGGRRVEHEAGPLPRPLVGVHDGVGQAARPPHDRGRAVAQRDHLALAAGLEAARHQEQVRAGVDAARHVPVEALDERDARRVGRGERPERVRERRVPAALDDDPGARGEQAAAPSASRSNPFCGSMRPIIPSTTRSSSGSKPDARQQVAPGRRPCRRVAARVGRREGRVGRRVPDLRVDAVEDPEEPVAERAQRPVQAHPERGRQGLARRTRARRC